MAWSALPASSKRVPTTRLAKGLRGVQEDALLRLRDRVVPVLLGIGGPEGEPQRGERVARLRIELRGLAGLGHRLGGLAVTGQGAHEAHPGPLVLGVQLQRLPVGGDRVAVLAEGKSASPRASWAGRFVAAAATALSALARAVTPSLARASARARAAEGGRVGLGLHRLLGLGQGLLARAAQQLVVRDGGQGRRTWTRDRPRHWRPGWPWPPHPPRCPPSPGCGRGPGTPRRSSHRRRTSASP